MPLSEEKCKEGSYIAFYVDDNLMVENPEAVDKALEALQEDGLVLKVIKVL